MHRCQALSGPPTGGRGKVERADEYFLAMKTTRDRFTELTQVIRANHSYEVSDIVAVPIIEETDDYLEWISSETRVSARCPRAQRY